jgi:6-phosphogluconolactonase
MSAPRRVVQFWAAEFASETARLIASLVRRFVREHGQCRIVLAGGRTPAAIYRLLAEAPDMPWDKVHVYVGDERCVPPTDGDSNFRMIDASLLSLVPLPPSNTHRLRGEIGAQAAAVEYDALIDALPALKFDIVLTGVGADGHTASLFPGDATISTDTRWAAATTAPPPFAVTERVTLTLRALNATRVMIVLCAGSEKLPVRTRILSKAADAATLPASLVAGLEQTLWIVDPA